jgi:DNA-directed RNA polymerase specialized sigma24 family protein
MPETGEQGTKDYRFTPTHWSMVLAAGQNSALGAQALEKLCSTYWYPIYAFIRREGCSPHDSQDLTQGFFAWLLQSDHLRTADPQLGKFRAFILARVKNYLSDQRKKAHALKRGGGQPIISLDAVAAEERYGLEPATGVTPEVLFERHWALTVMERTAARLRQEYIDADRAELFQELRHFQAGEEAPCSGAAVAQRLGLSEAAAKAAIFRMRRQHRNLLRKEIAQTVGTLADVDDEIRHLITVLGS